MKITVERLLPVLKAVHGPGDTWFVPDARTNQFVRQQRQEEVRDESIRN